MAFDSFIYFTSSHNFNCPLNFKEIFSWSVLYESKHFYMEIWILMSETD